jgi:hypothetical protein
MQKLCTQCETLFTPKQTRGSEQIYCSPKCRNNAAQTRMINKIKQDAIQETRTSLSGVTQSNDTTRRESYIVEPNRDIRDSTYIDIMEKNYEARNKISELELKNLYLTKEIEELKQEIINLELELEEAQSPGEENEGMLGGIMKQFKEDPVTTVSFATELINNLFKPKINA